MNFIEAEAISRIKARLASGVLSEKAIGDYRDNVFSRMHRDDPNYAEVGEAFDNARPSDSLVVFMGFCPGADFSRRQDIAWKAKGICEFEFDASEPQVKAFNQIRVGDLIVLKKREKIGKSMKVFGHGRVTGVKYNAEGRRYLDVNWSSCDRVIEVPLMACNATVNRKTTHLVASKMPPEFHEWLREGVH